MSTSGLGPERRPVTRSVVAWLEVAAALDRRGDGALAAAIRARMDGRRLGDLAPFALDADERARVEEAARDDDPA